MKRIQISLLLLIIVISLAACSSNADIFFSNSNTETIVEESTDFPEETSEPEATSSQEVSEETSAETISDAEPTIAENATVEDSKPGQSVVADNATTENISEPAKNSQQRDTSSQPVNGTPAAAENPAETQQPESTSKETEPVALSEPTPEPMPEPEPDFDIGYWISYAKGLATTKGLVLDSAAVDCWDNPIDADASCIYLERDINSRLSRYAADEDITDVWIWYECIGTNQYLIYIGYA